MDNRRRAASFTIVAIPKEDSMSFHRPVVLAAVVVSLCSASSSTRLAATPAPSPRATIGHYNGDAGINIRLWSSTNGDVPPATIAGAPPAPTVFGPLVGNADN